MIVLAIYCWLVCRHISVFYIQKKDSCLSRLNSSIPILSLIDIIILTVDALGINTMIILLLPLITAIALCGIIFCFTKQFLALFWNKSDTISLGLGQITINSVGFVYLASQLIKMDVIRAILVIFGCPGVGIMYYITISNGINTNGINTTMVNENEYNLIKFDIIAVGIGIIAVILLNSACLTHILSTRIKFFAIYNVTNDSYNRYKDVSNSG